ncbi:hypothetical protein NTGM5_10079 [Candidatus Nitrotoga sp. M5]|nr:hypothetical protein NTGM5_10079 [Candidatus Nitrotoga sp. M5]
MNVILVFEWQGCVLLLIKHAICISIKIMINGLSYLIYNKFTDVLYFIRQYNILA